MNCVHPLAAWWSARPNEHGHHYAAFGLREGFADRPLALPCGKCIGCIKDRARDWSVRCYHESLSHERNCFLTLTYAEPAPPSVSKPDLQGFFKRLRSAGFQLRYFAVGEYGSRTRRPHYHAIIFGQDFLEGSQRAFDSRYYFSPVVTDLWGLGHVQIAPAEAGSIFYTCGYTLKDLGNPDSFHLASKRPYIGHDWVAKYRDDFVRNGFVTIDGNKLPVPRAYLSRKEHAVEFDYLRERRRIHAESQVDRGQLARTARCREINLRAQVAGHKGTL